MVKEHLCCHQIWPLFSQFGVVRPCHRLALLKVIHEEHILRISENGGNHIFYRFNSVCFLWSRPFQLQSTITCFVNGHKMTQELHRITLKESENSPLKFLTHLLSEVSKHGSPCAVRFLMLKTSCIIWSTLSVEMFTVWVTWNTFSWGSTSTRSWIFVRYRPW